MRVTKEIAQSVAMQLCANRQAKLTNLKSEEKAFIRSVFLKSLPEEVKLCFEKHPDYFRRTSSIYINGPGLALGY